MWFVAEFLPEENGQIAIEIFSKLWYDKEQESVWWPPKNANQLANKAKKKIPDPDTLTLHKCSVKSDAWFGKLIKVTVNQTKQ